MHTAKMKRSTRRNISSGWGKRRKTSTHLKTKTKRDENDPVVTLTTSAGLKYIDGEWTLLPSIPQANTPRAPFNRGLNLVQSIHDIEYPTCTEVVRKTNESQSKHNHKAKIL